jgi:hypothetical protein
MTTKANLVEGSSHKKRYEHKFNRNNNKSNGNNTNMFKPKPNNFKKKKIVLCVANLTTMHLNAEIERETTILLKVRSIWLKEKTSLLRFFLKSIW